MNEILSINQRALDILQGIVECYIHEGQPVASKRLAERGQIALSSATLRNIMSELEAAGYLVSPHTSAGRVPTTRGYRLFVDHLLMVQHPAVKHISELQSQLRPGSDAKQLLTRASAVLSDLTGLVGMVSMPKQDHLVLRQVEFLPLSEKRVLAILVMGNHQVQNRVMTVDRHYVREELQRLGRYLTEHFVGCELGAIRDKLVAQINTDEKHLNSMMQLVSQLVDVVDAETTMEDFCMSGQSKLLEQLDQDNYHQIKRLFEAVSEKRDLLSVFDRVLDAEDLQIFIGEESGHEVLDACSVVTAPYAVGGKLVGVLGVIGPTRMPYREVISAVDVTAKLLSDAFCDYSEGE